MGRMNWQDINYWNQNSYGNAYKLSRLKLIGALIVVCLVTPFTNWMIPVLPKLIKKDIIVRDE
jgi:hypothetical protein